MTYTASLTYLDTQPAKSDTIFNMLTKNRSTYNRCRWITGALALLLIISISATNARQKATPLVVADVVKTAAIVEQIPLSGTVASPQLANISGEVSGLVEQVLVDVGSRVSSGDILATLHTDLRELDLKAARAATTRAREELADAKRRLTDARRLAKKQTITENELQSLEAEVKIADASVQRYGAEQALQEARLQRHNIKAPFAGLISKKYVTSGEWVQPGTRIMQLVATDDLHIDLQVPQHVYPRINKSSQIRVHLDAFPSQEWEANIEAVVPFSDDSARTMLVRATLNDSSVIIAPGMSASATLHLTKNTTGTVVPRDAILRYPDGRITAWVVNGAQDKTIVTERHIKTGLSFNGQVEILDGLQPGERIVVKGNESLKDNQSVRISTNR